jgi:hypothetical protein
METPITSTVGKADITTTITDPTHDHAFSGKTDVLGSGVPLPLPTPYFTALNFIVYTGVDVPPAPKPPIEVVPIPPPPEPPVEEPPVEEPPA